MHDILDVQLSSIPKGDDGPFLDDVYWEANETIALVTTRMCEVCFERAAVPGGSTWSVKAQVEGRHSKEKTVQLSTLSAAVRDRIEHITIMGDIETIVASDSRQYDISGNR